MKRILCLFLAAVLLCATTLTSCSENKDENNSKNPTILVNPDLADNANATSDGLMSYKGNKIPAGIFRFLLSQTKSAYIYSMTGTFEDDPALWSEMSDDNQTTMGQVLFNETLDSALSILYYSSVAQEKGITLTREEDDEIITALESLVAAYGSRAQFNTAMLKHGVGYNTLRDFYRLEALAQKGADSVMGEKGSAPITEEDLLDYYKQNFVTLRHIYFNTAYNDPVTGQPLTEEQKTEKSARADVILDLVNNKGKKLSDFKDESEDGIINDNANGVTIPLGELLKIYASYGTENNVFYNYYFLFYNVRGFAEAALMYDSGVVTRVDNEGMGIFLVERTPLVANMFDDYKDAIREFILRPQRMSETIGKLKAENAFTIDNNALATYSIENVEVMTQLASTQGLSIN